MPTCASKIMLTSFAPSPMARVMGCSLEALISFTICKNKNPVSVTATVCHLGMWLDCIYEVKCSYVTCAFCSGAMRQQSTALQLRQISRKISLQLPDPAPSWLDFSTADRVAPSMIRPKSRQSTDNLEQIVTDRSTVSFSHNQLQISLQTSYSTDLTRC